MARETFDFQNDIGEKLVGQLETPDAAPIRCYAIFAHCFTCGKDIAAASRISRALSEKGIAVLRFDFTGLGNSGGDFANTNFSSNVSDLISAANAIEKEFEAPQLLIGHSLGGAAVLAAASCLDSVRAVSTIASPSTAEHVEHLFAEAKEEILEEGEACVSLGGRHFRIKKQLLDDLRQYGSAEHLAKLGKALLVFHSPADQIVSIDEAAKIYKAARHPKSFISLDGADHLLSRRADSEYVAQMLSAWASRFLCDEIPRAEKPSLNDGQVFVGELNQKFLREVHTTSHSLLADEPFSLGGSNRGPTPYDFLLAALGTCTSMTLRMYASRKKMKLDNVDVRLSHSRSHLKDCQECDEKPRKIETLHCEVKIEGELSSDERASLLRIAGRCPVHKTLASHPNIEVIEWG